ncbi:hypothetical protein H634G_04034 [Metarhizium anisopliae BRIP 53293]|uniref:Cytochrome P450 n=1 Tax=Metarhizium anisopliae BRIP 53293 TaxID=1291518 RepID=A0A0D9P4N7_METAN|nr:hypothetical protein H634G_04034 [Metarhizium anisopliae BRIP 53293]KJK85854.1 hypothetical protein H633G_10303 [Metarhizium anisopliae BRIP 53284]
MTVMMEAIAESHMAIQRQDTVSIIIFLLVLCAIKHAINQWYGHPSVGRSRLWTLLLWQTPTRLCLDKWATKGYQMYHRGNREKPFYMKIYGLSMLVMPPKYLDALKSANHHTLSFAQSLSDSLNMEASLGDLGTNSTMEIEVVAKGLNPRLAKLVPELADENRFALDTELGILPEWTAKNAFHLSAMLVHRVTNRVLVGKELARNEPYIAKCMAFSQSVFINGVRWNFLPLGPFRKLVYRIGTRKHRRDLDNAAADLLPMIKNRMADRDNQTGDCKRYEDAIQWNLDLPAPEAREATPERHAHRVLHLTFAAAGTVAVLLTHLIYQILMYPEYLEPLRQEIKEALDAENGEWTDLTLTRLRLFDSFVRETLRVHPPSVFTAARTVLQKPYTFSDGFCLPKGAQIAFPTLPIHMDPENYDKATEFDGYRFLRLSKVPGEQEGKWGASRIDKTYLPYGFGRQACPGRFYGVRKVKLIFGTMLHEYDIRWKNGQVRKDRPPNIVVEGQIFANNTVEVEFRTRRLI